jgi:hypothetical protein
VIEQHRNRKPRAPAPVGHYVQPGPTDLDDRATFWRRESGYQTWLKL